MIRGLLNGEDGPCIVAGLSEENVRRLKIGNPIHAPLETFGLKQPGSILICYGASEPDIQLALERATGVENPDRSREDPRALEFNRIISENAHVLVATVGLPRSGKSTWAREQGWPIVNPDSIRLAIHGHRFIGEAEPFVWATAKAMVSALFLAGHNIVILDACNNSRKRRDEWSGYMTYFHVIDTPAEVCIERARAESDEYIVPVIERMAAEREPLGSDEMRWP